MIMQCNIDKSYSVNVHLNLKLYTKYQYPSSNNFEKTNVTGLQFIFEKAEIILNVQE